MEIDPSEPLVAELGAFIDTVRGQEEPAVTGQQGAAALEVALEITRLIQSDSDWRGVGPGLAAAETEETK